MEQNTKISQVKATRPKSNTQLLSERIDRLNFAIFLLINEVRRINNDSSIVLDQIEMILSHKEG